MRNPILHIGLAAALIATAACTGKKKKDLPPLPPQSTAPADTSGAGTGTQGATDTGVANSNLPGSLSDFVAQSGSDRVLFGYDSYELDDTARGVLGKQAEWLARYG